MKKLALVAISMLAFVALLYLPSNSYAQSAEQTKDPRLQRWEKLMPQIHAVLRKRHFEEQYAIRIVEVADLIGDGHSEALVYPGSGGAYTDWFVLMQVKRGSPVLAKIKLRDGRITDGGAFTRGSSVMHSENTALLPKEHAIYAEHWSANEEGVYNRCEVEAYRFNPSTGMFEFNRRLSRRLRRTAKNPVQ
jgi:hypothetical protein